MEEVFLRNFQTIEEWNLFSHYASSAEAYKAGVYENDEILNQGITTNTKKSGNLGIFKNSTLTGYSQYGVNAQNVSWFSIFIFPEYRNFKIAEKAIILLNKYLFEEVKVNSIRHTAFLKNEKIIHLLKKTGATEVGIFRQGGLVIDKIHGHKFSKMCLVLEFNKLDYETNKKYFPDSASKSYGINNKEFLVKEITRLSIQKQISTESETVLNELIKLYSELHILDIGCGTGNVTEYLAKKFKDNNFIGIDECSEFISYAKTKYNNHTNIDFIEGDILADQMDTLIENSDVFLFRMVVQHLGVLKFERLINKIKQIKKNNRFFIIVTDTDDRMWVFEPENPALNLALRCANHAQLKYGGERNIACKVPMIAGRNGLKVTKIIPNSFSSAIIGNDLFDKIINPLFNEKLDSDFISESEIIELKEMITNWQKLPNRFGIGMTLTILIESEGICAP